MSLRDYQLPLTESCEFQPAPTLAPVERPNIVSTNLAQAFRTYIRSETTLPLFLLGDALSALREIPDESVDCLMTSPPYWGQRDYQDGAIGSEVEWSAYISNLLEIFLEIRRILKSTGSLWLNVGDTYHNKSRIGLPWRICLRLMDEQGWILRNDIIWNKIKGGLDNTRDRLANVHEPLFHFVKVARGYYYDVDAIRSAPGKAKVVDGKIVSASGVSGVRYKRQIELSTNLTSKEKTAALEALTYMLNQVAQGELSDFRMIIRGQQRTTHSDSERVSGRARELNQRGFYFLKFHPEGSKPGDVWDILPEDTQGRQFHFASYPEDLCKIPIIATCPKGGVVVDPFCGTGTTMLVASELGRKSVGIDIVGQYLELAISRVPTPK